MKKKNLNVLLTALITAALLAGCGSGKMSTGSTMDTAAAEPAAAAASGDYLYDAGYMENDFAESVAEEAPMEIAEVENEVEYGTELTEEKAQEAVKDPQAGRKLITTMDVSAETEHFDELMGSLEKQVTDMGGYIESSNQWNGSVDYYGNRRNDRSASLTVRIPAEKLDSFITMMEEASNITNKSKSVEDVTLAYVDLESHKKALQTEEKRLLELLEMAETVEDLITVEDKLANVRYQLESMESQLRTYDNRINYSTVYLNIQEVTRLTPVEEPTTWSRIRNGFSENLYNLGEGLKDFFIGVVINIPYIVLALVLLAIAALLGFWVVKHDKKKRARRPAVKQQTADGTDAAQEMLPYGVKDVSKKRNKKTKGQEKQEEQEKQEKQEEKQDDGNQ